MSANIESVAQDTLKKHIMGYLGSFVYFLMYSCLTIIACYILFIGPIEDIFKNETVFTENLQAIKG